MLGDNEDKRGEGDIHGWFSFSSIPARASARIIAIQTHTLPAACHGFA